MTARRSNLWVLGVVILLILAAVVWASDKITLQGERTIYSVKCEGGAWQGNRCTGKLVAGERYGFRVSLVRREVIYWVRGTSDPSGKFGNCDVIDRDNWSCKREPGQAPSITTEMKKGRPTRGADGGMIQFHDVPKWKWWIIDAGIPAFSEALK